VTTVLVQQERHVPSAVVLMDQPEEFPEILGTLLLAFQEQPRTAACIQRPEEHSPSVASAERDFGVFPASSPAGPQRREQQEIGLVLEEDHIPSPQLLDILADPSHLRGPSWVRVQNVTRSFPNIAQGMQLSSKRGVGQVVQSPVGQVGLQQRYGPSRGLIAEVIRWLVQGGAEDGSGILAPLRGPAGAVVGDQGTTSGTVPVQADPSVNRATTDLEHDGHIGDRLATVELEQCQSAAIGVEVGGRAKQSPKAEPLLTCQMKGYDGSPHNEGSHGWARGSSCAVSSEFFDVLRNEAKNRGKHRSERG
jgi:hypothetical protein